MKIALTSMDIEWENKSVNRKKCVELIKRASDSGARLILFPEMTLTGFTMNIRDCGESSMEGRPSETVSFFLEQSLRYEMAVGFGYIDSEGDRGKNHFMMVDNGRIIGDYSKIHPFSFGGEDRVYDSGEELVSVNLDGVGLGLFVCYDLRFPEIFQKSSEDNEILAVIANWPKSRVSHWNCLLPARAVETQSIVLGVNRKGMGNGLEYVTSSKAFDGEGERLEGQCTTTCFGDECIVVEVEPEAVIQKRREFPVKNDRKKQLYRSFYEE